MVGLLDLVVVVGCVGLLEREREREREREKSDVYITWMGSLYYFNELYVSSKKEKKKEKKRKELYVKIKKWILGELWNSMVK